jgi:hypothetical protein
MPAFALVRSLSARTSVHVSTTTVRIRVLVLRLIRVRIIPPRTAECETFGCGETNPAEHKADDGHYAHMNQPAFGRDVPVHVVRCEYQPMQHRLKVTARSAGERLHGTIFKK